MSEDEKIDRPFTKEEFNEQMDDHYQENLKTQTIIEENKQINAEIQNKKLKIQKKEIDRISSIKESLENEDLSKRSFSKANMLKDIEDRKNAVTFLNGRISKHFVAAPSSLIVIPSMTNNGKSTLTAAIAEALVREGKRVLLLSNEEKETDARARVSCLRVNVSFGDYKTDGCTPEEYEKVLDDAEMLANSGLLVVVATTDEVDAYKVTTVEGIMNTLQKAKGQFDAVLIDYYTNVNISELGTIEPWHVNNRLASELNIFKDTAPYPIIVMAQCEGIKSDKKVDDKGSLDFDSNHPMYRWKGGKSILTYATDIIELVKDFDNSCSFLFAHKVRFGHGDLERQHMLPFDKKMQKFVDWSPAFDAGVTASKVKRKSEEQGKELNMGNVFDKRT
tara:strand:+ start:12537 stop:13709 length:1173 start_codon:yes stop_codon:yes gene_type:complete